MKIEVYDPKLDVGLAFRDRVTRAEIIRWIVDSGCDHAVTLVLNATMPLKRAVQRVGEWLYRFEKITRKCRPERLPLNARLLAYIVPEHIETNIHFHMAIRLVDGRDITVGSLDTVYQLAEQQWSSVQPSGSLEIETISDFEGWASYMTKDYYLRGTSLILSCDFHNSNRFTRWNDLKCISAWA